MHGHVFDFECRAARRRRTLIPNGVQLEVSIEETGDAAKPIECTEVVLQGNDGAELLSDFDEFAHINAEAKVRNLFAYAGEMVLMSEELKRLYDPDSQPVEQA